MEVLARQNARAVTLPRAHSLGRRVCLCSPTPSRSTCGDGHRRCTASRVPLFLARRTEKRGSAQLHE
eukprot:15476344-Alexandrium_andersonii.AAC.1